jgi:hypothetical protein
MKQFISFSILTFLVTSCTLSFQNITIDTVQGQSTDDVEDSQSPTNDIKPNLSVPLKPF